MTDRIQSLHDDLDYVKMLAHQGRHAPLTAGPILLLAGVVWGTAALLMYAYMRAIIPANQAIANGTWIAAGVIFVAGLNIVLRGIKRAPGSTSLNNRANSAGWKGAGYGIFAFGVALTLAVLKLHDINLVWLLAPAILTLYGTCWTVASAVTDGKWPSWLAVGSYLGAVLLGSMAGQPEMFLAYALTLYLLAGVPGYLLMRGQPGSAA